MARPDNVRVIRADGTVIACELAHGGVDTDGLEVWNVATELGADDRLAIGAMSSDTKICAPVSQDVARARVYRQVKK